MSRRAKVFPARLGAFADLRAFVDEVGAAEGVDREGVLRLTLMVEELFTNTVAHGHGRDSDAPVLVALEAAPEGIVLTYEDTAPAYDPFTSSPGPERAEVAEPRPVGGLGVPLVRRLATRFEYRHVEGKNRVTIVSAR